MRRPLMTSVAAALFALAAAACDNPNKQNDTGEELQEAAEKTGDAVEQGAAKAARAIEHGARRVGEELEQGAHDADQKIDDSAGEVREHTPPGDRAAGSVEEVPAPQPKPEEPRK